MILRLTFILTLLHALRVAAETPTTSVVLEGPISTATNGQVQIVLPAESELPKKQGISTRPRNRWYITQVLTICRSSNPIQPVA